MAHNLDFSNSRANMAYVGETPWHGLGQSLTPDAGLDVWIREAGFDWEVIKAPVTYAIDDQIHTMPDRFVLHRSDTGAPLSVVSDMYNITQPRQVVEFFRDLCDAGDMRMETMGMLKGGAVYWALARIDDQFDVGAGDMVLPYMLLATSADGTMSNCATFTTVRVVCQNTLSASIGARGERAQLRIPHSTEFDPERIKRDMGLIPQAWDQFKKTTTDMSLKEVSRETAMEYFLKVLYPKAETFDLAVPRPMLTGIMKCYDNAVGQHTMTADGTVWGMVNAVTRWADHEKKSTNVDNRLTSAWFGSGDKLKRTAWAVAAEMVA